MSFLETFKESTSGDSKQLWTGLCEMEVVSINPSAKEIAEMYGSEPGKDPVYTTVKDGATNTRLDFWLQNKENDVLTKMSIFVEGRRRVAQSGLNEYINRKVQTTWDNSPEDIGSNDKKSWYDTATARHAFVGEVSLYDFITKLTNASVGQDDSDLEFDSFEDIVKGDVAELRMINDRLGKTVKVLLGVRDGKYQDVFNKCFMKGSSTGTSRMEKEAYDDQYGFKSDFGASLNFVKYNAPEAPVNSDDIATEVDMDGVDLF